MRFTHILVLAALSFGACKSSSEHTENQPPEREPVVVDAALDDASTKGPPAAPTPSPEKDMKQDAAASHDPRFTHIFMGKPIHEKGSVCATYKELKEGGPAPPVHDATIFKNRHHARISLMEILRGPAPGVLLDRPASLVPVKEAEIPDTFDAFDVYVALALDRRAFPSEALSGAYGEEICKEGDALLTHPYVVLFARHVYVDHGNSEPSRLRAWSDLGIDPYSPHKGFDTIEEAREYAAAWRATE